MIRVLHFSLLLFVALACSAHASMMMSYIAVSEKESRDLKIEKIVTLVMDRKNPRVLNIDKSWHGIHFLLTGSAQMTSERVSLAILGGREFGENLGYGPARLLSPAEVKEVARLLKETSVEKLKSRFDPKKMEREQIYPDIWVRDGNEALDYLLENYERLSAFYANAAASGDALVLVLL